MEKQPKEQKIREKFPVVPMVIVNKAQFKRRTFPTPNVILQLVNGRPRNLKFEWPTWEFRQRSDFVSNVELFFHVPNLIHKLL